MPLLPMMNFQFVQPQGNPLARNMFSDLQEGMKTAYMPQTLAAELQKQQLANQLAQTNLQYAPQMNEADLASKLASANLMGQQAEYYGPNIQSEMALRNIQAALMNQTMQYKPFEIAGQMDPITKMIAGRMFAAQLAKGGGGGGSTGGSTAIPTNISTGDSGMTITPTASRMPVDSGGMSVVPGGLAAQLAPPIANTNAPRLPGGLTQDQGAQLLNGVNNVPANTPNVMNQGANLGSIYDNLYKIQFDNAIASMTKNPAFGSNRAGQGGTYTDPLTGGKFTTDTSANTTTDQTTIAAVDRVIPLLQQMSEDLSPFQTLLGKSELKAGQLGNFLYGMNNQYPAQYARGQANLEAAAEGLLKAWGLKVTNEAQESMKNYVRPQSHWWGGGESPQQYRDRIQGIIKQLKENASQASARLASGQNLTSSRNENDYRVYNHESGDIE